MDGICIGTKYKTAEEAQADCDENCTIEFCITCKAYHVVQTSGAFLHVLEAIRILE